MMTIKQFSLATSISASALRFYERKGVLAPEGRDANGYRRYSHAQIEQARLVSSLRNAGISLENIKLFLRLDFNQRLSHLESLQLEVEHRLDSLNLALKYLRGMRRENDVYLFKRDREHVLWFQAQSSGEPLHFLPAVARCNRILEECGIPLPTYLYLRPISDGVAYLGYRMSETGSFSNLPDCSFVEDIQPTLYVSLTTRIGNALSFEKLKQYIAENQLVSIGDYMELLPPHHVSLLFRFIHEEGLDAIMSGKLSRNFFDMTDYDGRYEIIVPVQRVESP